MKTKKFLFYLLAVLLGGCVPVMSLHPLYTEKDLVFEEKLLGTWVDKPDDPETIWEFKDPNEQEKVCKLVFVDNKGDRGLFDAHLVRLEDKLFLDLYPGEPPWGEEDPNKLVWPYNTLFLLPAHTFIRVNGFEPGLKLQITDDDEMEKLLKEDPNAVKRESVEDGFVLTASTKELQAFVLKYADDSRLFTKEAVLIRQKTGCPNEPDDIKPDESDNNR